MVGPVKRKALLQFLDAIIEMAGKESGCLIAGISQDARSENDFLVIEKRDIHGNSDSHVRYDIFPVLIGAGSLVHQSPEIMIHMVSEVTTL